ncbi:MAG TPA: tRNA dihydrouridine synthase DusB [Spirochaetota bacterium]|nr:tRNA dihydrouridine synthase DusB [Spirochaetota bacterium]HPJ33828.1 tRNA dihydrouridine synthase DusB [Spirochaetota bacterium]
MIEIGKIKLQSPLVLAPIAGFTDSPFRRICVSHGCALTMTELISAEGIVRKNKKTMDLLKFTDMERPFAIQIFGRKPETLAEAAAVAESLEPDLIDINMGCPARKVVGSGNGAALLREPALVARIAEAVVKKTKIPVSAKIRTGWDESSLNYMDVVKALEDSGISFIIVHGRTRVQQYTGHADWNIIREIREKSSIPVIGNGDIDSYEKALEMMEFSGCPAVMIGRGAIGNPWIFSGRKPEMHEIIETIKLHLDLMLDEYGNRGIHMMRKHIVRYIHGIKNAARARSLIVKATGREEIIDILNELEQAQ